jgi:hypothetical protein
MLDFIVIPVVIFLVLWSNRRMAYSYETIHAEWLRINLNKLFIYHFIFSFLFPLLPGDASGYWQFSFQQVVAPTDSMFEYFGLGTKFLLFLDYIPVKVLGLSFLTGNILYGTLGFAGLRYLFLLYYKSIHLDFRIGGFPTVPFLFYLPNLNFWTGGVGKDTLCFFCIACIIYCIQFYKKRLIPLTLCFVMVYFIRPHVAFMLAAAVGLVVIFGSRMKFQYRVLLVALLGVGIRLVYAQILSYLKIDDLSVQSLNHVANGTAFLLGQSYTGSAVDVQSYSYPVRIFTYLFRPLFFDVHNVITLVSSFENLTYMIIVFWAIPLFRWKDIKAMPTWMKIGVLTFVFSTLVFSSSLGNLGIIMRMKNMTMIYLLMYCTWTISRRKAEQVSQHSQNALLQG